MFIAPPIATFYQDFGRFRLRPWRSTDSIGLTTFGNDPSLYPVMLSFFPQPYQRSDALEYLRWACASHMRHLAIEVNGYPVGGIGVALGAGVFERSAELSYWIHSQYRQRGILTAATRAFLPFVFTNLRVERLTALVVPNNVPSVALLQKFGFQREGVMRRVAYRDGQFLDLELHSLLRDELVEA